jgi:hypothetical protein
MNLKVPDKPTVMEKIDSTNVSFVELKGLAQRLLPSGSTLRAILLSQPDIQSKSEAMPKMEIFVSLLYKELGRA